MKKSTLILVIMILVAIAAITGGWLLNATVYAMDYETQNQRQVAYQTWKHQAGYYEYAQFTQSNK